MKTTITTLLMTLTLNLIIPTQESNAGLVVGFASGSATAGFVTGFAGATYFAIQRGKKRERELPSRGMFGNAAERFFFDMDTIAITPFIGVVLDVDANLPSDVIIDSLQHSFPFIDNVEIFENIARSTKDKFKKLEVTQDMTEISVSFAREEVLDLLSVADITSDQLEEVISALE
jgi:hypothetical protein